MLTAKRAGLSGTALKTIALVLMVLDHIHYFLRVHRPCAHMVQYAGTTIRTAVFVLYSGGLCPHA